MFGTLRVLMWKHLMVRIRKYINTTIELLFPLAFFILLFVYRDIINPVPKSQKWIEQTKVDNTVPYILKDIAPPQYIYYTPDTPLTQNLMDLVGPNLGRTRLRSSIERRGYGALSNVTSVLNFLQNMGHKDALVIFQDMEGDSYPKHLNYTIRMKINFVSRSYEPTTVGAHSEFGRIYDPFMRLQWAIDTSYLEALTGNKIDRMVTLQEFPYIHSDENQMVQLICSLLRFICCISLLLVFIFLMSRLLQERSSGIQELIKMVGVSVNVLNISHFLNVLPTGLVYCIVGTILLKVSSNPLLPNSNGFLIALMMLLYFISMISMAFACSYVVNTTSHSMNMSVLAFIVLWLPARLLFEKYKNQFVVIVMGLLPHFPMMWFWRETEILEGLGQGVTFSNMMKAHNETTGSVFLCYVFLIIQSIFYFILTWYLSLVRPGKYGQALPWNFLFQKQYWTKKKITPELLDEQEEAISQERSSQYFEDPPRNMDVGIKIKNVSKIYPKHKALSNVSLDVYKGEITVLLGHNGAGKTTLMSIITGMISATDGKVFVNDLDTSVYQHEVRKQLGLCPQHNLFFSDLTVLDHLMFFYLLKGGTFSEAKQASMELLNKLGLQEKGNSMSSELSGGMKRRLQLACALSGGAAVLVLDEPTSGLDVQTRRELWDLLLSLRGDRTVLLTTHFMEEADALGDRVAALHAGKLKCHATTMYLKKAIGTGYRLSFTTIGTPKESDITAVVTAYVPDAIVKEKTLNSLSYNLPATSSSKFPKLFSGLEDRRAQLGIDSIGVGVSTLEEVFLRLCSDTDTSITEDTVDNTAAEPSLPRLTGFPLYLRQAKVLCKRQYKFILSRKISFLLLQVLIPLSLIFLITKTTNNNNADLNENPAQSMNLDLYDHMSDKRIVYNINNSNIIKPLENKYNGFKFEYAPDIIDAILHLGNEDIVKYYAYIAGVEMSDTNLKALFTTTVRHAAPVTLNLLSNLLAQEVLPYADGATITTINHPNVQRGDFDPSLKDAKQTENILTWAMFVVFLILSTNTNAVSLACKERLSGSRHIHIMSGCPVALHWFSTLLFHMTLAFFVFIIPTVIAILIFDNDSTLTQPHFLGTLLLIMVMALLAFLAFVYFVSFHFGEKSAMLVLFAVIVIFGFISPSIKMATDILNLDETKSFFDYFIEMCGYMMPPHSFSVAIIKNAYVARLNALCSLNRDKCPFIPVADAGFDTQVCCNSTDDMQPYLVMDKYAPAENLLHLALQFIFYMTLVVLTQYGVFNALYDKIFNVGYKPKQHSYHDEMVRAEKVYVDSAIQLPKIQINDAMLVHDVHKMYHNIIRKSCHAVNGISFSVKKGECFGLLGVNGAGKSTTFKMLTAEETATRGKIFANGQPLTMGSSKYLQSLGYCPQFFGLDEFQTGKENLVLLLTLRGLLETDVKNEVNSWINVVGLEKYMNREVSAYSGGCMRRLGTAAALSSGAPLTLLDEPTAGVDVAARRRVWAALKRALNAHRAVVITSHSMDEMEALCGRIGLMSGGELAALGSPAALRAAHAAGHALVFKLNSHLSRDETDGSSSELRRFKGELHEKFNCTLKDEHKTMLHYHINETMRYSELFTQMEELKSAYPGLIEDYSVTETTLEEVFLSFAKEPPTDLGTP